MFVRKLITHTCEIQLCGICVVLEGKCNQCQWQNLTVKTRVRIDISPPATTLFATWELQLWCNFGGFGQLVSLAKLERKVGGKDI